MRRNVPLQNLPPVGCDLALKRPGTVTHRLLQFALDPRFHYSVRKEGVRDKPGLVLLLLRLLRARYCDIGDCHLVGCTIDVPQIFENAAGREELRPPFKASAVEPHGRIELEVTASCFIDSRYATIGPELE